MRSINAIDHPRMRVLWDVCNSHFLESAEETWKHVQGKVLHVHFKAGIENKGKHQSVLPGEGTCDLPGIYKILKAADYDGYLSFEWEKKWQPELAGPEVAFPHYIEYVKGLS